MKITQIDVFQVDLPLHEGRYNWAGGKSVAVFDSTVVRLVCDSGLVGHGEVCPLGPVYLPAFAAGVRAALAELAPALIGTDPRSIDAVNDRMDRHLKGQAAAKSALDMACWDILGKACDLPVHQLLGGRFGETVALYRAISQEAPAAMAARVGQYRSEGYRRFQLKVGGEADEDIERIRAAAAQLTPGDVLIADANTGWLPHQARRVIAAVRDLDIYIEQPCASYEECLTVRRACRQPFVLDESIVDVESFLRAHRDGAMDAINIKLSKLGGLTRARQLRDLCVRLGIAMTIEDSWGGDITTAAIAALAHSTPQALRFTATDFNSYVTRSIAEGAPQRRDGAMAASLQPGLGVTPHEEVLGAAVFTAA